MGLAVHGDGGYVLDRESEFDLLQIGLAAYLGGEQIGDADVADAYVGGVVDEEVGVTVDLVAIGVIVGRVVGEEQAFMMSLLVVTMRPEVMEMVGVRVSRTLWPKAKVTMAENSRPFHLTTLENEPLCTGTVVPL